MKAVVIEKPGGPEVLKLKDIDDIHAQRGEMRVRVRATALNRADLLQRAGKYPAPPGCSADIPGLEYAGEVDELGDSHSGWKIGDRVFGLVPGGSYAQNVVVHPRTACKIPDHLSFEDAAALPEAAITAYDAMVLQAGLKSGDYVLITAAASGVATIAVQIAGALGARSIGLTRGEDKRARLLEEGNYQSVLLTDGKEFAEEVKRITDGAGVDVVLELVGGHYLKEDINCIAKCGHIILVGLIAGHTTELNMSTVLAKRTTIKGTTLRARPLEEKIYVTQMFGKHMVPFIEKGLIKPIIDAKFGLGDASKAHEFVESNKSFGKVVLVVP